MSQQVITTPVPSIPRWRGRSIAVVALVALLAAGAGAAIGALLASDSSVTYRSAATPPPTFTPPAPATPWAGNVLLAVVTTVPEGEAQIASLSPHVQQMIGEAADAAARGDYLPVMPDTETLFGLVASLAPADRVVIMGLLPPGTDAAFDDFLNSLAGASFFG
jgi:hypothetical protein